MARESAPATVAQSWASCLVLDSVSEMAERRAVVRSESVAAQEWDSARELATLLLWVLIPASPARVLLQALRDWG